MTAPSFCPEIMPGWAAVNKKGEPTVISQPTSVLTSTSTPASAASSSKSTSSTGIPPTRHQSLPKTLKKPKKKKKTTDASKPATPAKAIRSPAATSDGSLPSLGKVIRFKQASNPKHDTGATSRSPTITRPVLAEADGNIQRGIPKCLPETPQKPARRKSKTVAAASPHPHGKSTDNPLSTDPKQNEPASKGKEVERREQPVREVKLMTSVEQTPRRGKGFHKQSKKGGVQCAEDRSDWGSQGTLSSHRSSRLESSTDITGGAVSVVEPASTGPDIIELSKSPSPQRCQARPASLDLGGLFSSPSRQLRASTEREPSPLVVNVANTVCHPEVVDGVDIKEEPVEPAERPRIIARLYSPSPPIILPLAQGPQPRRRNTALIKQADHARVQRDLEEHNIREIGEARFLTSSYKVQRQIHHDFERDSHRLIKKERSRLKKLKRRMENANHREHVERCQRRKREKERAQQPIFADVTQVNHDQLGQRPLPDMLAHDQPAVASLQFRVPHAQGHRAPCNTPEPCLDSEGGNFRKRATTIGACSASQDKNCKSKLQSQQQRSSSVAAGEGVHKNRGSSVKHAPKLGEVVHGSKSQHNAAKGLEPPVESNPVQVSKVKPSHDEGTVGNEKAPKTPKASKAAKSVKPTATDWENASISRRKFQSASSRPEQPPKTPKSARIKSSKSDAEGNSTTKSNFRLEATVQHHGRDLQQGLQKPAPMMEGTVWRPSQSNIEVRALVKSRSSPTEMASPVAPPSFSKPRRSLPTARHLNFATLAELKRREVDIPLPSCTCQHLSPYFTEQQKRLPSRYNFYRLYNGGPLEFFVMISQIMDCGGHHDCVRDHCRSLWDRETERPETWCTFPPRESSSASSTSCTLPKTASAEVSQQEQTHRTEAESRTPSFRKDKVTRSTVHGQPTPPTSSPSSSKKRKRSHVKSRGAEAATALSPQADQSDDTTSSSPLEKRSKRHTSPDASQESSTRKELERGGSPSLPKATHKSKKRRHQSVPREDYHDELSPVATPSVPTLQPTSSGTKRKRPSSDEQDLASVISPDNSPATCSTKDKERERPAEGVSGDVLEVSPPQSQGDGCSIKESHGKRQCISKKDIRRANESVSPLPSVSNDIYSEDDWRPFPEYPDDMLRDTVTTPPASSLQTDEPSRRKASDETASKPSCPAIDTPAPARFASVPASRLFGHATQAVMNMTAKPQSPSVLPSARPEDFIVAWKQKLGERLAADLEKRAKEAVKEALAKHEVAGPGPRTVAARKRNRTHVEDDDDDPEYLAKLYPLHTRLSNEKLCAIARDTSLGPQKRHDAAPYAFDPKNGQFREEYEYLFPQIRFKTIQAAKRFLRTY